MGLWGAVGQGGGAGVPGAVLEQGITGVRGCQGAQGLLFCQVSLAIPHCAFCSGLCWGAALGLLMTLCLSHPLFLTSSGLGLEHGGCEFVTHTLSPFPAVPGMPGPSSPTSVTSGSAP